MSKTKPNDSKVAAGKRAQAKTSRYRLTEPVPESVQSVLQSVLAGPPKKDWRYLRVRKSSRS